ncbi:MAG: hypothetical protein ABI818_05510 [Acidobacteriota bacterium]
MTLARHAALALFSLALASSAWALGNGPAGWLYLLCYACAAVPGLPLGWALFGRDHAGGWIAGVLLGYALTAIAIWAPIAAHVASAPAFVLAWGTVSAITWSAMWSSSKVRLTPDTTDSVRLKPDATESVRLKPGATEAAALIALPPWTPAASTSLLLVLLVTLAIAAPPLANVGRSDAAGNRYYRAYFTADFVWHTALTAELAKYSMPPRNPYLAHRPIHYYWTYYLFPAAVSQSGPPPLRDVERCLKLNALMTGLLLMSAVFLAAWAAVGRAMPVGVATTLALVASSAEGLYETWKLWSAGRALSTLREWNIDAVTAWPPFGGHRIDGLQRCLWYVPQHSMAYALGLMAIAAVASAGSTATMTAIVLTGIALGCSVAFNPLVGGIFALAYGIAVTVDALRRPNPIQAVARHAAAILPVIVALGWCYAGQMTEGAGNALQFGLLGASRQSPVATLLLSLGPILLAGLAGLWASRAVPLTRMVPALTLLLLALFLMYFVRLSVDTAWVAFRAGQLTIIALAVLAARFIALGAESRLKGSIVAAVVLLCLAAGLPTTVIDEYNARDIHNLAIGPGFPWTIVISPQQQRAFAWIRQNTAADAVVQMEPNIRGRSTWSLIPSFAQRRMSAGLPISLMDVPEFHERSDRVRAMYQTASAAEALQIARALRIDYVYLDDVERAAYPGAAKFDISPEQFERVFDDSGVSIYRVR